MMLRRGRARCREQQAFLLDRCQQAHFRITTQANEGVQKELLNPSVKLRKGFRMLLLLFVAKGLESLKHTFAASREIQQLMEALREFPDKLLEESEGGGWAKAPKNRHSDELVLVNGLKLKKMSLLNSNPRETKEEGRTWSSSSFSSS